MLKVLLDKVREYCGEEIMLLLFKEQKHERARWILGFFPFESGYICWVPKCYSYCKCQIDSICFPNFTKFDIIILHKVIAFCLSIINIIIIIISYW